MIVDTLEHAEQYLGLNADIDLVLKKAGEYHRDNFPAQPLVLSSSARLNNVETITKPAEEGQFEAHRKYIDVMIMIDGEEMIYVKEVNRLKEITQPYDEEKDILFAKPETDGTAVRLKPGMFCILFPQDAHIPGRISTTSMPVKKLVGKVRIG